MKMIMPSPDKRKSCSDCRDEPVFMNQQLGQGRLLLFCCPQRTRNSLLCTMQSSDMTTAMLLVLILQ